MSEKEDTNKKVPDAQEGFDYSKNVLIDGKKRVCTDIPCCLIFLAHWALFFFVNFYSFSAGDPLKLIKPRDYKGDYCGISKLKDFDKRVYTMNVSSTLDPITKELLCSSIVDQTIQQNSLLSPSEYSTYLCACCKVPCKTCTGSLKTPDYTQSSSLSTSIAAKTGELASLSGTSLFTVSGANGNLFSSIWSQASAYFVETCSTSCNSVKNNATRSYSYTPAADDPLKTAWFAVSTSSLTPQSILDTMNTKFTFSALPPSVCPYPERYCVPYPGVEFSNVANGYCTFKMSASVINSVGAVAAQAFTGLAADKFASTAVETFGQWLGDLQKTIDVLVITSVASFVIGLVFMVLLRFCVGPVVWTSLLIVWLLIMCGGALAFVRSGQCDGTGLLETGSQTSKQVIATASTSVQNQLSGQGGSEAMTGVGHDYRGFQSMTRSGKTCQNWGVQTPHSHTFTPQAYPDAGLNNNHCRNPDQSAPAATIWCYTTDISTKWEVCTPIGVLQPQCPNGYAIAGETARNVLKICSFITFGIAGLWLLFCLCFCSRIRLAIACAEVAATFTYQTPVVLLVPVIQTIIGIIWCVGWALSATFLVSQVPDSHTPTSHFATYQAAYDACVFKKTPEGMIWKDESCPVGADGIMKCWKCAPPRYLVDARVMYSFFSFLWNNALLIATGQCIIAGAVVVWFFAPKNQKTRSGKVQFAFWNAMRYHFGSLAFGSFILAVVQFVRYALMYLEKQSGTPKNRIAVLLNRIVQCILWCFEKCIKFLNRNAYIQIAIKGTNFCQSALKAFSLILQNFVRFGVIAILGNIIHLVGYTFIMAATLGTGYLLLRAMQPDVNPVVPMIVYAFISYLVGMLYINIYAMAVDSSLQCFLTCEELGEDAMPPAMQNFVTKHAPAKPN